MRKRLAIALIFLASCTSTHNLPTSQTLTWKMDDPRFGGLSGFDYIEDGKTFVVTSDRGGVLFGSFARENGEITQITASKPRLLPNAKGGTWTQVYLSDAEGVAAAPDGSFHVSFEGYHRVSGFDDMTRAHRLPRDAFVDLPTNGGLEALAVNGEGHLFAIPERSGQLTRAFPLYRYVDQKWEVVSQIKRRGGFLPVGADFGPDGYLYLLERSFSGLGFRSRIRRFSVNETGAMIGQTLLTTPLNRHGNLEGIAIWRAPDGLRATMVSDDNFRSFQSTQVVEYQLPDPS